MNIKVFVFQHFPCRLPGPFADRSIYVPVQCGRALHNTIAGTVGDDTGDNISRLNKQYNEMTAIYWIAKHYEEIGNPEYIGFNHYRRSLNWSEGMLAPRSVVVRKWFSWRPLRNQYANCHDVRRLDLFSSRLEEEFDDEETRGYKAYWKSHSLYICNMFVMHRDNFMRYAGFILKCIDILRRIDEEMPLDLSNKYQARQPSFILERMTGYWIWREKRRRTIDVVPTTITHFDIENPSGGSSRIDKSQFLWFLRQAH